MSPEIEILKQVCGQLDKAHVAYMLTGSLAANFYATPRMTRDIDIVIELDAKEIDKIFEIFQNDFYIDRDSMVEAIKYQNMFNIIHNDLSLKIDFIIRKDLEYRLTEFQRRKRVLLEDAEVWIVSAEDLIISKLYWAKDSLSEIQLKDIRNLLSSIRNLDSQYIHDWVNRLKLVSIYDKVHTYA